MKLFQILFKVRSVHCEHKIRNSITQQISILIRVLQIGLYKLCFFSVSVSFRLQSLTKMAAIAGKYSFVSQDKFDDYLKAAGKKKHVIFPDAKINLLIKKLFVIFHTLVSLIKVWHTL